MLVREAEVTREHLDLPLQLVAARRVVAVVRPREPIERPKQGLAIPLASWLRGDLAPLIDEYLSPSRVRAGGLLDQDAVRRAVANFREGGGGNDRLDVQKVWLLLAFEMWRSRWDQGYRRQEVAHARAVHD